MDSSANVRIGISSCILGNEVRYDGQHKHNRYITDQLGAFVEFVPVCPEVELGLGIPRDTLRLVHSESESESKVRLVVTKTGEDLTGRMERFARKRLRALKDDDLSGYILQKGSPSCGMERVKVYAQAKTAADGRRIQANASKDGRGLFAAALMARYPYLPVEEDGRLNDARLRENFIERVFAYRRMRDLFSGRWTVGQLVAFHSREKLFVLAHDPAAYRRLGKLVAGAKDLPRSEVRDAYQAEFMTGLSKVAKRGRHMNALQHIAGYFRQILDDADRREIQEILSEYERGLVPLIVPMTLLKHHIRRHQEVRGVGYLAAQTYLSPHPAELMLRNHT